jgi:NADH-ubiquinone oxidoreductase chain 2
MMLISILILIVAMALPSINRGISSIFYVRISSIILLFAGALSFNAMYIQSIGSGIGLYSGLFQISAVSGILDTFILFVGSLILIAWPIRIEDYTEKREYSLIILFSVLGSLLLLSSADLISMYLSIELQSFGVYILATLYRKSLLATGAGLKYFLLGGLSSCFILLGSGLVYTYTGLTNLESIYSLLSVAQFSLCDATLSVNTQPFDINNGVNLGLVFIFVGFLFKIAAAPLHNWAIDVYNDSPTIVTIWLTIMPKIAITIFLLELYSHLPVLINVDSINSLFISLKENMISGQVIKYLLLISSLLSLILGTVVGLAQTKIKRLLAYSTVSHVGFLLLALAINSEKSIDALIFYLIQYSITSLNTFLILIAFGYIIFSGIKNTASVSASQQQKNINKDIIFISQLKGQFFSNPLLTLSLAICLFSMAGVPPLIGFFSKQFVLYSAIQNGYNFMAIVAIIVSVISASYYLKIVRVIFSEFTESSISSIISQHAEYNKQEYSNRTIHSNSALRSDSFVEVSHYHSLIISILTITILFFIMKPSILLNLTQLLSLSLFYT